MPGLYTNMIKHAILTFKYWIFTFLLVFPIVSSINLAAPNINVETPMPPSGETSINRLLDQHQVFLPYVGREIYTDLTIGAIELTQGVQDSANSVPLVKGRPVVLRIFAQTNTPDPIHNVMIEIDATRNGVPLPNSPVVSGPYSIPNTWERSDINSSINIRLPAEWLVDQFVLEAEIDPQNDVPERSDSNNLFTQTVPFTEVAPLDLMVVPIEWEGINGFYPAITSYDYIEKFIRKMYPVSEIIVQQHRNYRYSGPLETLQGWDDLLNRIWTMRSAENAPNNRIYYGLIPVETSSGNTWLQYGQGIQGNGFVGARASIGLGHSARYEIEGGIIAAHEIGHNLGRLHSPCGVNLGVGYYPYPGGIIGQLGLDITKSDEFNLIPETHKDIMSYCSPTWVSDYTYRIWMENQKSALFGGTENPSQPALLLRAEMLENSDIVLQPIYSFDAKPVYSSEQTPFLVEFLDDRGELVSSYYVEAFDYGDTDQSSFIGAVLPLPDQSVHTIRIRQNGVIRDQRTLQNPELSPRQTLEITEFGSAIQLTWGAPDTPALVRVREEGSASFSVIAVDWRGGEITLENEKFQEGARLEIILANQLGTTYEFMWDYSSQR